MIEVALILLAIVLVVSAAWDALRCHRARPRDRDVFLVVRKSGAKAEWVEQGEFGKNYTDYFVVRRATIPAEMPLSEWSAECR